MDLFAGAGGMSLGLERAGFRAVGAAEYDAAAAQTYQNNFGSDGLLFQAFGPELGDVRNIDFGAAQRVLEDNGIERLDLLSGGPPCQGFSRAGRGKIQHLDDDANAGSQDQRNELMFDLCRAVAALRPRAVLVENVTGMLQLGGQNHAEPLCEELESLGYRTRLTVLNAAWYGVPQNRERLFVLGLAADVPTPTQWFPTPRHQGRSRMASVGLMALDYASFSRPERVERHWPDEAAPSPVPVGDAFEDIPSYVAHLEPGAKSTLRTTQTHQEYAGAPRSLYAKLMREWEGLEAPSHVEDHYCRHTPRDFPIFARMRHGDTYPAAVEIAASLYREAVEAWDPSSGTRQPTPEQHIPPYPLGSFDERWKKLDPARPSWTVTAHLSRDCYSHIHPDGAQARTISVREAARLQSFPDGFRLHGNTGDCYRQILSLIHI